MLQNESLAIDHFYKNLKCRIIQKSTQIVLCCKLINNCIQTLVNINRDLEQFYIQLYQDAILVGVFSFNYDDLDKVINQDQIRRERDSNQGGNKRKKYIKFKKQTDCCALYFTIQTKDIVRADDHNINEDYIYEDYVRHLANKFYRKFEKKAIDQIKKIEIKKFDDRRLSLIQNNNTVKVNKKLKSQQQVLHAHRMYSQSNQICNQKILQFSQSLMPKFQIAYSSKQELKSILNPFIKTYKQIKQQYKMKRLREKAKKLFHKQIKQKQKEKGWGEPIIPVQASMSLTKGKMNLMSEGIKFPTRIQSQSKQQIGIRTDGFRQVNTINSIIELSQSKSLKGGLKSYSQKHFNHFVNGITLTTQIDYFQKTFSTKTKQFQCNKNRPDQLFETMKQIKLHTNYNFKPNYYKKQIENKQEMCGNQAKNRFKKDVKIRKVKKIQNLTEIDKKVQFTNVVRFR